VNARKSTSGDEMKEIVVFSTLLMASMEEEVIKLN
jgi:hypothetical protein